MNLAIFAVIVLRERQTDFGDDIRSLEGLGRTSPWLAWPLTIGFLALAGLPGTSGFIGKLFLIEATVDGDFTWLGVAIVVGTMVSLAYYLRVLAAVWIRPEPAAMPAIAGAAPLAEGETAAPLPAPRRERNTAENGAECRLIVAVGVLCAAATVFFGVIPSQLVDWASAAGESLSAFLG